MKSDKPKEQLLNQVERCWNRAILTLASLGLIALLTFAGQPPFARDVARLDARILLIQLDCPLYPIRLNGCKRAGTLCRHLNQDFPNCPQWEGGSLEKEIVDKITKQTLEARSKSDKIAALNAWKGLSWYHSPHAQALAREALESHDKTLVKEAIPLIEPRKGELDKSIDKLIEIGKDPEFQQPLLERFARMFNEKGFPWGSSPKKVNDFALNLVTSPDEKISRYAQAYLEAQLR